MLHWILIVVLSFGFAWSIKSINTWVDSMNIPSEFMFFLKAIFWIFSLAGLISFLALMAIFSASGSSRK